MYNETIDPLLQYNAQEAACPICKQPAIKYYKPRIVHCVWCVDCGSTHLEHNRKADLITKRTSFFDRLSANFNKLTALPEKIAASLGMPTRLDSPEWFGIRRDIFGYVNRAEELMSGCLLNLTTSETLHKFYYAKHKPALVIKTEYVPGVIRAYRIIVTSGKHVCPPSSIIGSSYIWPVMPNNLFSISTATHTTLEEFIDRNKESLLLGVWDNWVRCTPVPLYSSREKLPWTYRYKGIGRIQKSLAPFSEDVPVS